MSVPSTNEPPLIHLVPRVAESLPSAVSYTLRNKLLVGRPTWLTRENLKRLVSSREKFVHRVSAFAWWQVAVLCGSSFLLLSSLRENVEFAVLVVLSLLILRQLGQGFLDHRTGHQTLQEECCELLLLCLVVTAAFSEILFDWSSVSFNRLDLLLSNSARSDENFENF